jgi:F-type H+-transporting ATPase subunit b
MLAETAMKNIMGMRNLLTVAVLAVLAAVPALAADVHVEGAGQHEPLQFIGSLLFWELVAFIILFVILSVAVFPKMFGAMNARQQRIEDALAKADRVNAEAETLLQKHQLMMKEAHAEAKRITEEAIIAGNKIKEAKAHEGALEAESIVELAKGEIRLAQQKAVAEIRSAAVELSLAASSAVLKRSMTSEDHRRLAQDAIATAGNSMKTTSLN